MKRIKSLKDIEDLKDFRDYAVDTDGNVWSYKNNKTKILKPGWANHRDGYLYVSLTNYKKNKRNFYIHRLVAMAFIPTDNYTEKGVRHLNGDLSNNNVENLDWFKKGERYKLVTDTKGYELDLSITKRIKEIHTASVRKGVSIPSSYDFMKDLIEKGIQEHVRQYGLQKILYQMNQNL